MLNTNISMKCQVSLFLIYSFLLGRTLILCNYFFVYRLECKIIKMQLMEMVGKFDYCILSGIHELSYPITQYLLVFTNVYAKMVYLSNKWLTGELSRRSSSRSLFRSYLKQVREKLTTY